VCAEGYCTAKARYKAFPSAYANGHAVQVCRGDKTAFDGRSMSPGSRGDRGSQGGLKRWFREKWVDVCSTVRDGEKQKHPPCGRKKATLEPSAYPYCRPSVRVSGKTGESKTAGEMTPAEKKKLCATKRDLTPGGKKRMRRNLRETKSK